MRIPQNHSQAKARWFARDAENRRPDKQAARDLGGYRHGNCKISRGAEIVISVCEVCGAEEREDTEAAAEGSVSDTILHFCDSCRADRQQYTGGTAADHLLP